MNSKFDYDLLSAMMTNANMGWWEADLKTESYICSEYISRLLGLDEDGTISFKDFNKRILKEEQRHTTTHSFDNIRQTQETVYLLNTVEGPTWIRSKICLQRTDENGNVKVYGIAETQDGPDMSSASQALQERNRLLHNIYKYLPVGIELYNREGILIDMNDKEQEMFHLKQKEDLLGINIFENPIFPEEMKSKLRKHENADFTFRYDFSKIDNYYKHQREGKDQGFLRQNTNSLSPARRRRAARGKVIVNCRSGSLPQRAPPAARSRNAGCAAPGRFVRIPLRGPRPLPRGKSRLRCR